MEIHISQSDIGKQLLGIVSCDMERPLQVLVQKEPIDPSVQKTNLLYYSHGTMHLTCVMNGIGLLYI